MSFTTPVLFLVFNRPDLTETIFDVIRSVRPQTLFISADGPRQDVVEDKEKCRKVKDILKDIDWPCDVRTYFRNKNVGCRIAISSAIDWFFENVNEGIILEDDCLPSKSFFTFCNSLLDKYRHDERIMQINGNNYLFGKKQINGSYYFSKLNGCWGWATWKRAWRHYDNNMSNFEKFKKDELIKNYIDNNEICEWLMSYLEEALVENCGIWSTRWTYSIIVQNGLCVNPAVNLVQNLGFREDATAGKNESFNLYSEVQAEEMEEIVHPPFILPDNEADNINFEIIKKTDPRLLSKKNVNLITNLKRIINRKIIGH